MVELVFLEPNRIDAVPFTTSKVIAEATGIGHKKLKMAIITHMKSLETFGKVVSYGATLGGRGNEVSYQLNEQQATLLITFLKNTPAVIAFKVELVRQFYAMRSELVSRNVERIALKPIRREMTDVIQHMDDNQWAYKKYTDLAYMIIMGKTAKKIREERAAPPKAAAIEYMTADEIHKVAEITYRIAVLLEMGMTYYQIKDALYKRACLTAS